MTDRVPRGDRYCPASRWMATTTRRSAFRSGRHTAAAAHQWPRRRPGTSRAFFFALATSRRYGSIFRERRVTDARRSLRPSGLATLLWHWTCSVTRWWTSWVFRSAGHRSTVRLAARRADPPGRSREHWHRCDHGAGNAICIVLHVDAYAGSPILTTWPTSRRTLRRQAPHQVPNVSSVASRPKPGSAFGYYWQLLGLVGWTSIHWLSRLRQPTLILSGADDPIVPPINARIMSRLIFRTPGCTFSTMDTLGC